MFKVLLDEGLPRSTVRFLSAYGVDAVHVGDCGLADRSDEAILAFALDQQRICCTLDADFHRLLATQRATEPSVVRIRIEGLRGNAAADIITDVLKRKAVDLSSGAAVTVNRRAVRVRRLPLGLPK